MTWQELTKKHQALSNREKGLILISGLVLVLFVGFTVLVEPQYDRWQAAVTSSEFKKDQIKQTDEQVLALEEQLNQEINGSIKREIAAFNQKNQTLIKELKARSLAMVSKSEMAQLLQTLLNENNELKLISFKSLPVQPISLESDAQEQDDTTAVQRALYQHGLAIEVEGRYFSILEFLEQIEQASDKILWQSVHYSVTEHPLATVSLEVYTLSTDKEFISVVR